jgi:hypothetical protein
MSKNENNPALYRKLSEPFSGMDMANASLEAFAKDLAEIREKHKIRDVACVVQVSVMDASGEEGESTATIKLGNYLQHGTMLAMALGKEQAEFESTIRRALAKK